MQIGDDVRVVLAVAGSIALTLPFWREVPKILHFLGKRFAFAFGLVERKVVEDNFEKLADAIREVHTDLKSLQGDFNGIEDRLKQVEYQLRPNGGGSLRDHVNRLDGQVSALLSKGPA